MRMRIELNNRRIHLSNWPTTLRYLKKLGLGQQAVWALVNVVFWDTYDVLLVKEYVARRDKELLEMLCMTVTPEATMERKFRLESNPDRSQDFVALCKQMAERKDT